MADCQAVTEQTLSNDPALRDQLVSGLKTNRQVTLGQVVAEDEEARLSRCNDVGKADPADELAVFNPRPDRQRGRLVQEVSKASITWRSVSPRPEYSAVRATSDFIGHDTTMHTLSVARSVPSEASAAAALFDHLKPDPDQLDLDRLKHVGRRRLSAAVIHRGFRRFVRRLGAEPETLLGEERRMRRRPHPRLGLNDHVYIDVHVRSR